MNKHFVDILLVEDNINDAELTIRELKKSNMANNLIHLKDGEQTLDFLFSQDGQQLPKLILLDINMPKINGIEVLQKIKSDPATSGIPVVILTSSKEDPDIKKCYALGVNSYIIKPVNFESFREAIKNLGFYWILLNQSPLG